MSETHGTRHLRADAARNVEKIIVAARECFHEFGPGVSLQKVAEAAGVGQATLFRNFSDKESLIVEVLSRQLRTRVDPVMLRSLNERDAYSALVQLISAIVQVAADESQLLEGLVGRRGLLVTISEEIVSALAALVRRGQRQGSIRIDVDTTDVVRMVGMLIGSVDTMAQGSSGWHRPVSLLADSLRPSAMRAPLPPQTPLDFGRLP